MNDCFVALLSHLTQALGGSLGLAIISLSFCVRAALLPLTVKLARRARRNQTIMESLRPEMEELRKRFEKRPELFFEEMRTLYRKHNRTPFDIPTLVGSFIQLPIFGLLYNSIRSSLGSTTGFLWIKNLASPDFYLTLIIISLTALSVYLVPVSSEQARSALVIVQVVITLFIVWKLAAGLSLYWVSSGVVTLVQTLWLRYRLAPSEVGRQ
jgi:YidC/Oxa1 family membrane protein insertase